MWTVALELAAQRSSEVAATLMCPDWLETCMNLLGELDGLGLTTRCSHITSNTEALELSSAPLSARQLAASAPAALDCPAVRGVC